MLRCRAIDSGANAIAEGFLFSVAAALIVGESWRSSRSLAKRREVVDEKIEELNERVDELKERVSGLERRMEEEWREERDRCVFLFFVFIFFTCVDSVRGLIGLWFFVGMTSLRAS